MPIWGYGGQIARSGGEWLYRWLWCSGLMLGLCASAFGQSGESGVLGLLMPGKLAAAHAKEEQNCAACHQSFAKEAQDSLCLQCHEPVAADIERKTGFHGRAYRPASGCIQCHREHLGREADITALEQDRFDHSATDFPLTGAHAQADCGDCHQAGAAHREAPAQCAACHRDDDRHQGALGEACNDCHRDTGWAEARFDHATTDFPLRGKHGELACALCHPGERYADSPRECGACHALDDVHHGSRGSDCAACHDEQTWQESAFDHDRNTDFGLRGAHRDTACGACHTSVDLKQVAGTQCVACHRVDDVHAGRNGDQCQDCHGETRWTESRFDHGTDTDFPLRGQHGELACEACHFGGTAAPPAQDCGACHRADDVHRGAMGADCAACHREDGWGEVSFSHDLASFPLLGMHRLLDCNSCHLDESYRDAQTACVDCHAQQDIHQGALGSQCSDCHNPGGWALWQFDHATATRFPLAGGHAALACGDCHRAGEPLALPMDCFSCHRGDDRHRGRFGRDCGRCHTTDRFSEVKMLR